jgi:hypothetical protein
MTWGAFYAAHRVELPADLNHLIWDLVFRNIYEARVHVREQWVEDHPGWRESPQPCDQSAERTWTPPAVVIGGIGPSEDGLHSDRHLAARDFAIGAGPRPMAGRRTRS